MWACRYTDINTSMLSFKQEPLFAYSGAWKLPRPTQKPTNHNRYNSCNIQLRLLYCCIWFRIVTGSGLMIHICYPWHGDSLRVFKKGISTFELFKLGKENLETGCLVIMIWLECELIQIVLIWYNNMLMHCNAIFVSKSVNLSFKIPPQSASPTPARHQLCLVVPFTQQQLGSQPNLKTIENCHFRRCTVDPNDYHCGPIAPSSWRVTSH